MGFFDIGPRIGEITSGDGVTFDIGTRGTYSPHRRRQRCDGGFYSAFTGGANLRYLGASRGFSPAETDRQMATALEAVDLMCAKDTLVEHYFTEHAPAPAPDAGNARPDVPCLP